MKKRILAAFLCVSLVIAFAGCKNQQGQSTDGAAVQEEKNRSISEISCCLDSLFPPPLINCK